MDTLIKVGIIGGAGYTAGELLRILIDHPNVKLEFIQSKSQAGKRVDAVHRDLIGEDKLIFSEGWSQEADVLFLCRGHNESIVFLTENKIPSGVKVIDLSHDFRLKGNHRFMDRNFVYGLPELNKESIRESNSIANPGCFATSIELALLPLAAHLSGDIHVHAITGSTGAGQHPSATSHFSWRDNNISVYKAFEHQHLFEIKETLTNAFPDFNQHIHLVPIRGNFTRGIFSTIYSKTELTQEVLLDVYKNYYSNEPFIMVTDSEIYLKQVINSNNCIISVRKHGDFVFIVCILDNLMKGASGQAVQNMNLMFGFPETTGLKFKSIGF